MSARIRRLERRGSAIGSDEKAALARLDVRSPETGAGETNPYPVLYFHPYEFDPEPLHARLLHDATFGRRLYAARRSLWRNAGRGLVAKRLRAVASRFRLVSYEQAYGDIVEQHGTRTRALSREGVLV